MLLALLKVVLLVVCGLLTLLAILQDTKGGGLAGALTGFSGGSVFGVETGGRIVRWTAYLAIAFFLLLLLVGKCEQEGAGSTVIPREAQTTPSVEVTEPTEEPPATEGRPRTAAPAPSGSGLPQEQDR